MYKSTDSGEYIVPRLYVQYKLSIFDTVNSEIFARILFSRVALKYIYSQI